MPPALPVSWQHLLPTHRLTALRQALSPELTQPQLMPKLAGQPAVTEGPRAPQLQTAQIPLDAVRGIFRQWTIFRKQTQLGELLLLLIEHRQCFAPRCLLL